MSTACAPVRCSGVTRPICQSQRIGCPVASRCGGYQQGRPGAARQGIGAGIGTTRQVNRAVVAPALSVVRTATRCLPVRSLPV